MNVKFQLGKMKKTYGNHSNGAITRLVIHETANTAKSADAQAHANLQTNGNDRDASWHYQVDAEQIIQSYEHHVACWHAGKFNRGSIAIELCVNGGFNKDAFTNLKWLVAELKEQYPDIQVVQHHAATGKDCPKFIRELGLWSDVLNAKKEMENVPNPKIGFSTIEGAKTFQLQTNQFTDIEKAEAAAIQLLKTHGVNYITIKGYK